MEAVHTLEMLAYFYETTRLCVSERLSYSYAIYYSLIVLDRYLIYVVYHQMSVVELACLKQTFSSHLGITLDLSNKLKFYEKLAYVIWYFFAPCFYCVL
jgi:hypothetical protein